jgi:hypothetical protein
MAVKAMDVVQHPSSMKANERPGEVPLPCLVLSRFNYVSTLTLVSRLADGRGLQISIVLVIHFLPSFIWFPVAGVIADRSIQVSRLCSLNLNNYVEVEVKLWRSNCYSTSG